MSAITLVVSLQNISPFYTAVEQEVVRDELAAGREVHVLHCGEALPTCNFNPTHSLVGCAMCQYRADHFTTRSGVPPARQHRLDRGLIPPTFPEAFPTTTDELMRLSYRGVNVGRGAASSVISHLREYRLDVTGAHRPLIELALRTAVGALLNYERLLDRLQPTRVFLFNGRHAETFPLVDLCQQRGLWFACTERGASNERYELFVNSLPHSIAFRRRTMAELWAAADPEARVRAASDWYEQKRRGTATDDRSYIGRQRAGELPAGWRTDRHNIVVFNSSEDEIKTISEWQTDLFTNQNEVILRLAAELAGRTDVHLYVRMHPNLGVVDNEQTRQLYALAQDNVTVIAPAERVDSYHLCAAADVILTFASTIGVEATYWGTASVLYGRAFYEGEGAAYEPQSFPELLDLLTQSELPAKPRANALRYGYYVTHYGRPFAYARPLSQKDVAIDGEQVPRFAPGVLGRLLNYLPRFGRWWRAHRAVTGRRLRVGELGKLFAHLKARVE